MTGSYVYSKELFIFPKLSISYTTFIVILLQ